MTTDDDDNFLSKISMEHKDDDDNVLDSILNKDDDNISKSDLDGNIATLIEKLQSLDLQESIIPEKQRTKRNNMQRRGKFDTKGKEYKRSLKYFVINGKSKNVKVILQLLKRKQEPKVEKLISLYRKVNWTRLLLMRRKNLNITDCLPSRILTIQES